MPAKQLIFCSLFCLMFTNACMKKQEVPYPEIGADTVKVAFTKQGVLLDTRTSDGLEGAKVSIYAATKTNSDTLMGIAYTDSNGYFRIQYRALQNAWSVKYVFEHPDPVFIKRTYEHNASYDKRNDSTGLFYLHRRCGCRITLKNMDGKQKNVMVFNGSQKFSKLLMNLSSDTTFTYLLQEHTDIVYFDYFPQKALQQVSVRGSTSGDTLDVEFKY